MLTIYAGKSAARRLLNEGFDPNLFTVFLGASGGPKWFTLFGLDKYLFGEFFRSRQQPLQLVGSSAGAFRSACFAQQDPVAAICRLAEHYSTTTYSEKPTPAEITSKARALLDIVVPNENVEEIIHNPIMKAHFIVAKTKGLVASEKKLLQLIGLTRSYLSNKVTRTWLKPQYQRFVFQSPSSDFRFHDHNAFQTTHVDFNADNLKPALLASGSIPLVMQGIKNIPGAPRGMYRDGGIIDYHFDLQIDSANGLVLYPHFSSSPRAGWFDKSLPRPVSASNYDNVVMLVPSNEFVAQLPFGKIPDREDFSQLEPQQRIAYWQQVLAMTEQLADDFHELCQGPLTRTIYPIESH
ncbi:patatin-like phospholipase family protein [Alteromonas flava]|uniref:patatin-like phospholipase family protein n=1 Tax=Alteromonas flava TaxID=2048003 RepID=UPI000C28E9C5|nr:patatin-like phospholipase family protein [Alteromonas flava]